ncbi:MULTISPECIES: hypothetical protein [unclassified Mesorhizobium]|uniref:hypothetical protein n=1 Tax=unclassified Mesorhizobium TaxID=325217 RepID=UPI0012E37C37|nr:MULTISPECIES: hypothetical protein [unclassified Mesorhizobium]
MSEIDHVDNRYDRRKYGGSRRSGSLFYRVKIVAAIAVIGGLLALQVVALLDCSVNL